MAAEDGKKANSAEPSPAMAYLALFAISFCLYALTASPAMGWLDSPEFVAQALSLGVAHSPGHPLVGLLGYLAALVPIGDKVWRVNLMSGLCAAGAVTLLMACARSLIAFVAPKIPRRSAVAMALGTAAFAGCSWALWSNAVRAEVYALQALLSIAAIFSLLRYEQCGRARDLLLAALLLALALANHHLLALTILLPGVVFVFWRRRRPGLPLASYTAALGLVGLCALAYLPIRSLMHPLVNFGAPHTFDRFIWTLRGAAFAKSAQVQHVSTPLVDALQIMVALADAVSVPLLVIALFAVFVGLRQASQRRFTLLLIGIVLLCVAARLVLGFDPETSDHHAYLLPAMFALWLLAIAGVAHLCRLALLAARPLRNASAMTAAALLLLAPIQLGAQWEHANQGSSWASDDIAQWTMQNLPPKSVLLIAYFQTRFRLWALEAVEGIRPDIAILDRSFLTYPGMAQEARTHHPELAELIDSPLRAGSPSPMPLLRKIARERPVFAELHPNLDAPLALALRPRGAFARLDGAPDAPYDQRARAALATAMMRASGAESLDALAALLWHDATRLAQLCFLGDTSAAAQVYADAASIAPGDATLSAMASACGLKNP